ncbi:MAG: glycosyltransferase family 4 protein [Methanomassiliicoccales archaeon]|nr:glycosyltransferase family 4 protein [Methanomassiliicoccales archaeon]
MVVSKFYPPVIGGVEVTVKELCQEYVRQGHEVTALVMTRGAREDERTEGVRVLRLPVDRLLLGGFNRAALGYMRRELAPANFDVVHVHNFHILLSFQSSLMCVLRSMPYVFSPHYHGKGHTALRDMLFKAYRRIGAVALRKASAITCASGFERSLLLRDFPGLQGKSVVISPGITRRDTPEVPREKDTLLYVGRLMRYKGLDHILAGMAELRHQGREVRLRVVGTGPDEQRLRSLAGSMGLLGSVQFLKELEDAALTEEYASASCLVLLSSAEAYGLVVAEALACGLPCVVAESAALTEFTSEPGCFGVRDPSDAKEVARVIAGVLEQGGRIKVGPFSAKISYWPEVARRYLDLYAWILARDGSA